MVALGKEVMDLVEKYVPATEHDENYDVISIIGGDTHQSRLPARSSPRPLQERNRSPEQPPPLSLPEREEFPLEPEIHPDQLDHLYAISEQRKKKEQELKQSLKEKC